MSGAAMMTGVPPGELAALAQATLAAGTGASTPPRYSRAACYAAGAPALALWSRLDWARTPSPLSAHSVPNYRSGDTYSVRVIGGVSQGGTEGCEGVLPAGSLPAPP